MAVTDMAPMRKKKYSDDEPILDFSGEEPHLIESREESGRSPPVRTCVVKREKKEKSFLLRFVLSPQNEIVPDIKGTLPGRGVWVSARKNAIEDAIKRRAFQRAYKKDIRVSSELAGDVEHLLRRSALERLSIANKAGLVVTGFVKVGESIRRREIFALLHAAEAAIDGQTKLDRKFAASLTEQDHISNRNRFTSAEISLATGSVNVIHAGLKDGGASRAFLRAFHRLNDYSTTEAGHAGRGARVENERNERNGQ